jgi:hypothetical protein
MIAGGQVDCSGKNEKERDEMERRIIDSFFKLMGKQEGGELTSLVPPPEGNRKENSQDITKREEVKQ